MTLKIDPRLEMNPDAGGLKRGYAWMARHYLRTLRFALEYRARWRHVATIEQKRCPFCNIGFFTKSGTAGRLACSSCGSHALDGRATKARKIEGA